MMLAIQWY